MTTWIKSRVDVFGVVLMAVAGLVLISTPRVSGQQTQQTTTAQAPPATATGQRAAGAPTRPPAPPEIVKATAVGQAAEVFAFEEKLDAAVLKGDTAAVDAAIAKDFVSMPDDHWTTGGRSKVADRATYLKQIALKPNLVLDLDQVKIEMHPDLGITYGRYVSLSRGASDAGLLSTWFQRVYAKENGQWLLLSARTVHGPTASPAGVDPTLSDNSPAYGVAPVWFLTDPAPPYQPRTADEKEIAGMDQKVGTAVVGGDLAYVKGVTTTDFSMVHGDLWTRGGKAALRDTQDSMLSRVGKSYGVLDFDHIRVEMHGDIAITDGRYLARSNGANADRAWFSVWFERVFAKRDGHWLYLSHRTVHGPVYGPDRQSVSDK